MANKCHPPLPHCKTVTSVTPSAALQNCNIGQIRVNMESRQPVEWVTEDNYKYATTPSPAQS